MILMKSLKLIALALLVCSVLQTEPVAQRAAKARTGKIVGVILDPMDARVVGASVTFWNPKDKRKVKSGEAGEFEVELPAGSYQITAEANGFRRFEIDAFKVSPKVTELVNIHLEVKVISDPY